MLHVVPELVRDDVRLGEIARRAEALAQLVVEAEVHVELVIGGTVERPGSRLTHPATSLRDVPVEDEYDGPDPEDDPKGDGADEDQGT